MLSILPRCAHASIQALLREAVDDRHACVGTVASIQTFGSYAANFHLHVHALITEGAFHVASDGDSEFGRVQWWDGKALNELFRRKVLHALRRAERPRPETEEMLLGWGHSGFSVHATEPALPDNTDRLEHLARYITRAPLRLDAISRAEDGRMKVRTPPAPQTGKTSMDLDPLDLIHRICSQIPAPRQHLVRYYGWYGNRARGVREEHEVGAPVEAAAPPTPRSRNWARLLRKIFEVDPMLCPQCGVKMQPVSVVQEVEVIDRILRHLWCVGGNDPWEGTTLRGPPAA